jgi:hypothetical protein
MVETVNNPEEAKQWLLQNPQGVQAFDLKYGTGAASDILAGTYKTPEQIAADVAQAEQSGGFWNGVGNVLSDIGTGITELPSAIARGAIGANTEMAQTMTNANMQPSLSMDSGPLRSAAMLRARVLGVPVEELPQDELDKIRQDVEMAYGAQGMSFGDTPVDFKAQEVINAMGAEDFLPAPTSTTGSLAEGISQFVVGIAELGGASGFLGTMLKGAVVDATAFEPAEANLVNITRDAEWTGPIVDNALAELATNPDDPEWENRTRNALVGGIAGLALEGLLKSIRFVAVGRKAQAEASATGSVSDETVAELDQVHNDIKDIETQRQDEQSGGLTSNTDGTFTDAQGKTYEMRGDKLEEIKTPEAEQPVATGDTPAAPEAPTPDAPVQTPADRLRAEAAPVEIKPIAKVEVLDEAQLRAVIQRQAEMSDFDIRNIDDGGSFNFERMEGPVEAAKVIDAFDNVLRDATKDSMNWGSPQSLKEVADSALSYISRTTDTGMDRLVRDLNVTETVTRDLAQKIVAGKMALQSTGREVSRIAGLLDEAVSAGKASEDLERKLLDIMQLHAEVQANVKGLQTSAARATSAGRIMTKDMNLNTTLDNLSVFGGSTQVRRLAKQIRAAGNNSRDVAALTRKAFERKGMGILNEYWVNQILSGFKTHALNITSNSINMFVRPAERLVGGIATGSRREAMVAMRTYYYMMTSAHEAIAMAAKSGWNHRAVLDSAAKVENGLINGQTRAISASNLGVKGRITGAATDVIGKLVTLPSRALGTEDEFFKQLSFRANLKANIMTDAAMMSKADLAKLGYATREEFIEASMKNAMFTKISAEEKWQELVLLGRVVDTPEVKAQFIKQTVGSANTGASKYATRALDEARQVTFTNPLQKDTFSANLQVFANRHPVMRQVIPFIQTPMNIMHQAWERTPLLNMLKQSYREALGSSDSAVKAEAIGKMATGVATYTALTALAMEGRITGGGPTDPILAALYRNSKDWQPYSINVGTVDNPKWISYQRLDPWATPFGIVGDIAEMIQMSKMADKEQTDFISMTIAAIGNNLTSKTYLQGISDFVGLLNSKDRPQDVEAFLRNRALSLMPMSGMLSQTAAAGDDYLREVRTLMDGFRSRIPTSRQGLAIKYDWISGQPSDTPENVLGYIQMRELTPDEENIALINSEMRRLGFGFSGADRKIAGVSLTSEQYQTWNQLIGTVEMGGKTLSERLVDTINSTRYNRGGDDYNMVTPQESHRVQMLNDHVSRYRSRARQQLMRQYPELRQAVREYDRYKQVIESGRDAGPRPEIDMNNLFNQ